MLTTQQRRSLAWSLFVFLCISAVLLGVETSGTHQSVRPTPAELDEP